MKNSEAINSSPRRAKIIWGVVVALFGLLQLFGNGLHIADRELWLDEASTYGVAAHSFWRTLSLPAEFHSQPPLYYVVLHFLLRINSNEWFIRGFSWLLIVALLAFVLLCLEELDFHARAFFALALVFSSVTHYLSQELRPYALCALTTFVATILLLRALRDPTPRRALHYAIVATLMLYSLAFDVWIFTAHGLFFVGLLVARCVRGGIRPTLLRHRPLILAFAGASIAYLPYLIAVYHWQGAAGNPSWRTSWNAMLTVPQYTETIRSYIPIGYPYSFALYGLVLLVIVVDIRERRADFVLWFLVIVGQIAFVQGFLAGRSFLASRYYTPAYPAFLFLLALGVHYAFRHTRQLWWIAPIVLAALAWDGFGPFVTSARAPLADGRWRSLRRELSSVPGRKVVFFDVGYNGQMLEYEARKDRNIVLATQKGRMWASGGDNHLDPEYIETTIKDEAPTTACFYYVIERSPGPYNAVFLPAMERAGYREAPSPGRGVSGFCKR